MTNTGKYIFTIRKHFRQALCLILSLLLLTGCTPAEITTRRMREGRYDKHEKEEALELLSLTESVSPGDEATLCAKGTPGVLYAIAVHYSSGVSKASGLEAAAAGEDGVVTWTWKIGHQTKPGQYRIAVTGGGQSLEAWLTVGEREKRAS